MTDLQTSLIAIGGALVIGVISYNKWQEFKAKKSVERAFSNEHDDVLMTPENRNGASEERHEPSLEANSVVATHALDEPEQTAPYPAHNQPVLVPTPKDLPIDPLIDCAVLFVLENPVRGDKILPVLQTLRHVGNKPVHFIGQRQAEAGSAAVEGHWESIVHGGIYTTLQAGVQMANRNNALNELEYSELVSRLREVADDIGAELELPDMMEIMGQAKELYQFVSDHDVQLGVNVQSKGAPWGITTLLAVFEKQGFDVRPDGRFVMPDGDGGFLFSLSTNVTYASETTSRLTLLLNVPCVAPSREAFNAMIACAKSQEARLDGIIVDDGNQPLGEIALAEIASQVTAFYDDMLAAEIPAGSTRAQRLFN